MSVPAIPEGYHAITPYLIIEGAAKAISFYQNVFAAELVMQLPMPGGGIAHCELKIGDSHIMLADGCADGHFKSPKAYGGSPMSIMLYVTDVDEVFKKALANGATEIRPVENQFYGDRSGTLSDPFGHIWTIGTHIETLTPEQITERMQDYLSEEQDA